jgi:hypothetical protein
MHKLAQDINHVSYVACILHEQRIKYGEEHWAFPAQNQGFVQKKKAFMKQIALK